MATFEDAAEELVLKLRGLDSEIEESEQKLDDLHERVDAMTDEVDQEWTALDAAAKSFLEKVAEERKQLDEQARQTVQDVADAQKAVAEHGAQARSEIHEGRARLDELGQHANGLEPGVESLAGEGGEAPAHDLAERARELEQELERAVQDAQAFMRDEAVPGIEALASEVREHCQEIRRVLAEEATAALQRAFDGWNSELGELEQHVVTQGFEASYGHARAVVELAIEECRSASQQQLDALKQLVGVLQGQLKELATEIEQAASGLVDQAGHELVQELERTQTASTQAVAALDRVRSTLGSYSFVEV